MSAAVSVGAHAILNAGATIAHEVTLGNFVTTIAPQAAISGNVTIEDGVEVGTGALIRQTLSASDVGPSWAWGP